MAGIKGKSGRLEGNPGNSGGKPYSKENREKAATLKGLSLDWMIKVMKGKDEKLKQTVILRIATTCIPQEIKHSGNEDDNTPIPIINIDPNTYVPANNGNNKDNEVEEEDKNSTGGNFSEQDGIHIIVPDSTSTNG